MFRLYTKTCYLDSMRDFFVWLHSFFAPQTLERVKSPFNGAIIVEKFLGKNRITVGGCWQSGEHAERITKGMLRTVPQARENVRNILVLGVGGGSVIDIINSFYPKARITGVEIDPAMIAMGKKYLHLSEAKSLDIVIEDAREFVKTWKGSTFDLILLDLYVGCEEPAFLVTKDFLANIKKIVGKGGSFLCNASNLPVNKGRTEMFIVQLRQTFAKVDVFHLPPNVIIRASQPQVLSSNHLPGDSYVVYNSSE